MVSRFSRMEFLCVRGVFDSAGPRCTRVIALRVIAFRFRGHRPLPDSQISELKIPPAYSPVQRFECSLTTALAWLGARLVRYSLSCVNFPFTAPRRFIPTLSLPVCSPPRSFLPLQVSSQGSRGFTSEQKRASLPSHASDMLSARLQAIGGARTFTSQDSQPCRLLSWDRAPARLL